MLAQEEARRLTQLCRNRADSPRLIEGTGVAAKVLMELGVTKTHAQSRKIIGRGSGFCSGKFRSPADKACLSNPFQEAQLGQLHWS